MIVQIVIFGIQKEFMSRPIWFILYKLNQVGFFEHRVIVNIHFYMKFLHQIPLTIAMYVLMFYNKYYKINESLHCNQTNQ